MLRTCVRIVVVCELIACAAALRPIREKAASSSSFWIDEVYSLALSIFQSIYLSILSLSVSILSIHLSIYLSLFLSIYLSIYLYI